MRGMKGRIMSLRHLIIVIVIINLCLSNFMVDSRKRRSKDVVKTIKTEDGVYDCVDFYNQPAFDHHSLKNHSFHPQMRPSFKLFPPKNSESLDELPMIDIKLKGATCPRGTVPIRRHNDDDLVEHTQLRRESYARLGEMHTNAWSPSNIYFALGQSKSDITKVYNGVFSSLSIFNPHVEKYQYSSGEIIIESGNDAIITGWTVNPMFYHDNRTRFFIYTVSGDSHCMNSRCGFIQVRTDIPLDFPFPSISTVEGTKYELPIFVYQDSKNGNWWLQVGTNNTIIGFWPQRFFRGLYKSANYVACGGEVYGPPDLGNPKMGSGYKPKSSEPEWSYCKGVQVVDEGQNVVYKTDLEPFSNNGHNYDVDLVDDDGKHYVLYGGPERY